MRGERPERKGHTVFAKLARIHEGNAISRRRENEGDLEQAPVAAAIAPLVLRRQENDGDLEQAPVAAAIAPLVAADLPSTLAPQSSSRRVSSLHAPFPEDFDEEPVSDREAFEEPPREEGDSPGAAASSGAPAVCREKVRLRSSPVDPRVLEQRAKRRRLLEATASERAKKRATTTTS